MLGLIAFVAAYMLAMMAILTFAPDIEHGVVYGGGMTDAELKAELKEMGLFKTRVVRDVAEPEPYIDWADAFR